ncbi:Uncharacterised protein [Klebsiella pneumoniae]|nr:Uncharacterised protein [Klebsiella pneumoniae]
MHHRIGGNETLAFLLVFRSRIDQAGVEHHPVTDPLAAIARRVLEDPRGHRAGAPGVVVERFAILDVADDHPAPVFLDRSVAGGELHAHAGSDLAQHRPVARGAGGGHLVPLHRLRLLQLAGQTLVGQRRLGEAILLHQRLTQQAVGSQRAGRNFQHRLAGALQLRPVVEFLGQLDFAPQRDQRHAVGVEPAEALDLVVLAAGQQGIEQVVGQLLLLVGVALDVLPEQVDGLVVGGAGL